MLATKSIQLVGNESFEQAFSLMPEKEVDIRYLKTSDGDDTGVYQIYNADRDVWSSPRVAKTTKDGHIIKIDTNSKHKLENAKIFYDIFEKPTYVGTDTDAAGVCSSWLIGDIDNCNIFGDDYTVQGIILSNIFDPQPKFYISFNRLVCENQFGTLGKNNSSMYINMGAFLNQPYTVEAKEKLESLIVAEVEKREAEQAEIYNRLFNIKLTEPKVHAMFEKLTVDKVAKNSPLRKEAEKHLAEYVSAYNVDDNQNYKGTLFGFVNAHTRLSTRQKSNPLDVVKPVITSNILNSPCDFNFLCREAVINANSFAA